VNNLHIDLKEGYNEVSITIYSILGQVVKELENSNTSEVNIDLSNLQSGKYILKVSADGNVESSILIKR